MTPPPSMPINYYEVLNCHPSDSIEEIKKSYQNLVLKHHPDKQNASGNQNIEQFYRIDEAWKMLRVPEQRKKYDAEMKQRKFDAEPIVHAKVYRQDFNFDSESQNFIYPCRCGSFFVLPDDCIESVNCDSSVINSSDDSKSNGCNENNDDDEIYIECDECSFVVQLLSNSTRSR
ncbi:dnaJ homolog subfamily C member 24-like [Contarinia nasturtii]|uniref:dnaJ homolog subfamily C member 24-like n=1 Tax=Contarinia nasturtii TaxID=265458 RepID=UPI0012D3CF7F|nr:dnaJ homolog subfamily C member 24-like [Contarinia nasturtii]